MAGRRELELPRPTASSLREQAARTTLRKVRLQGHTYVELREEGKRFIFFCTLCRAPCYNDSTLFDHLSGNLHRERYEAAKVTLLGSNPWPFNDGVLFFHDSPEQDKPLAISSSSQRRLLISNNNHDDNDHNNNGLALVNHGGISNCLPNGPLMLDGVDHRKQVVSCGVESRCILNINDKNLDANGGNQTMIIREVVIKDEISDLQVKLMGFGQISARICENEISKRISRIWCAWLGKQDPGDRDMLSIPDYEFGVVIFSSTFDLGRKGLLDDLSPLLSSSPHTEIENVTGTRKKRRKSLSDPEDISESLSDCGSSGEDFGDSYSSMSRLLLDRYDDHLQHTRLISSKNFRRELRRQQRVAAERMCDVCQHKMLPGKDVATLLNMKTGRFACSSRNLNGAFHVFHTSCLIHWILLCELEIWRNQSSSTKMTNQSGRKSGTKCKKIPIDAGRGIAETKVSSVFCPECQGTGIIIEGDELEKPSIPLSEMFNCKIEASDAHRAWMKGPEILQNCSIGLRFPDLSEETVQEKVLNLKLLRFYRANGE